MKSILFNWLRRWLSTSVWSLSRPRHRAHLGVEELETRALLSVSVPALLVHPDLPAMPAAIPAASQALNGTFHALSVLPANGSIPAQIQQASGLAQVPFSTGTVGDMGRSLALLNPFASSSATPAATQALSVAAASTPNQPDAFAPFRTLATSTGQPSAAPVGTAIPAAGLNAPADLTFLLPLVARRRVEHTGAEGPALLDAAEQDQALLEQLLSKRDQQGSGILRIPTTAEPATSSLATLQRWANDAYFAAGPWAVPVKETLGLPSASEQDSGQTWSSSAALAVLAVVVGGGWGAQAAEQDSRRRQLLL